MFSLLMIGENSWDWNGFNITNYAFMYLGFGAIENRTTLSYAICQQKEDVYPQLVSYQSFDTLFSGVDITHPFKVFHECLTTITKIAKTNNKIILTVFPHQVEWNKEYQTYY